MPSWTTHELDVLRQYSHMGAGAVSAALWHLCRTRRSPMACQRQASRIGVSMALRHECPVCGFTSTSASDFAGDGTCRACYTTALARKQRADVELLRSCRDGARRDEFERTLEKAEREYTMLRQQKHRLREEVGEEAVRRFEIVSREMSNRRSEAQKSFEDRQQSLF